MFQSIRLKLSGIAVLAITLCAFLVFWLSINEHEKLYLKSVEQNLQALSLNTADDLLAMLADDNDEFAIGARLLQLDRHKNVVYAKVFTTQWTLTQQYVNPRYLHQVGFQADLSTANVRELPHSLIILTKNGLAVLQPIGEVSAPEGYLLVVHEYQRPLAVSKRNLFYSAVPFVLLTILLSVVFSSLVYQRMLTPLLRLSAFTKDVEAKGDYTLRTPVTGNDEVSQLGHNINSMLSTIYMEHSVNKEQTLRLIDQQASMQKLANFDTLTDLPNRMHFMVLLGKELERCRIGNSNLTILFFDVDGFKGVNDTLGHEVGDILLQLVGESVQSCLRENDVLARLGGDEFLVMLPNASGASVGVSIAERIISKLSTPFKINGWDVKTGVSIGIASAKEASYEISTFIGNADLAMYRSKERGKGLYTVFNEIMLDGHRRKAKIANLISSGLDANEFSIHYQIKVSREGQVAGLEALLRWTSKELGSISPGEFIPVAEQAGAILEISRWVINQVFKDLPALKRASHDAVVVSLNISSHDLQSEHFIDYIELRLLECSADIRNVQFEVTESAYLGNFDVANRFFNRIHKIGGSIALDDFGTGYSSLSYLTKIQIDTLKIDRMFVARYDTSAKDTVILQTILELAQKLGLTVCSEGIETAGQANYLLAHGCDQMQGFYFAKPAQLVDLPDAIHCAKETFLALTKNSLGR